MKRFNITGTCFPDRHYMVPLDDKVSEIKEMIDYGEYFCINKGRQYGKTTLINALVYYIENNYSVFSLSFEPVGESCFQAENKLSAEFINALYSCVENGRVKNFCQKNIEILEKNQGKEIALNDLSDIITVISRNNPSPIVVIIDEVDQASNYHSFMKFLGMLRNKYLERNNKNTFQSVILASVYNIKNLKFKMRPEAEHQYNSPWNIAAPFEVDMSLSENGIYEMLLEYQKDREKNFDAKFMAKEIRAYTNGYPFLVSRICQIIDKKKLNWDKEGFLTAIREILIEPNTLFDDLNKKINTFPKLRALLEDILYYGIKKPYNIDIPEIELADMFSFIRNNNGLVAVNNRIFETRLYNRFIQEDGNEAEIFNLGSADQSLFIKNGVLNMDKVLEKFVLYYNDIYSSEDEKFLEKMGRKIFLMFIRPIINGAGNYYIEAQTRNERRTDIIIDYGGKQYIIELKIWRGNAYNEAGEEQLAEYLNYYHLEKGYMVSFCFNKNKIPGVELRNINGKLLLEAIV